jgi:hypothetical protein
MFHPSKQGLRILYVADRWAHIENGVLRDDVYFVTGKN